MNSIEEHTKIAPFLNGMRKKWLNKRVIVLTGKYAGREATTFLMNYKLTDTYLEISAFVHIKSKRDPSSYLWVHADARSNYDVDTQLKLIEES